METEKRCRKYTRTLAIYMILHQFPVISALANSFYCMSTGNFDTSTWLLPVPVYVPFDIAIIRNWYAVLFFHLNGGSAYIYITTLIASSFIAFCLYICAMCDHFDLLIRSTQRTIETNEDEKNPIESQKRIQLITETLCNAIKLQNKTLEWVDCNEWIKTMKYALNIDIIFSC